MHSTIFRVLSLVAFASILGGLGGCSAATTRTTAWVPRYYPAPESVVTSHCDVAICDSHTSNPTGKL